MERREKLYMSYAYTDQFPRVPVNVSVDGSPVVALEQRDFKAPGHFKNARVRPFNQELKRFYNWHQWVTSESFRDLAKLDLMPDFNVIFVMDDSPESIKKAEAIARQYDY